MELLLALMVYKRLRIHSTALGKFHSGERMRRPNFFIVGAPKCGTTAMNDYLKQHPDIYIPAKKEITFFGKRS